jgi:hypothetical protein
MNVPVHMAACPAPTIQTLDLSGEVVSETISDARDWNPHTVKKRVMMILVNMAKIQSSVQDSQFVKFNIFIILSDH